MNPESVVEMIAAVARAVEEVAKFLQTVEGQKLLQEMREGRVEAAKQLKEFFEQLRNLLQGG